MKQQNTKNVGLIVGVSSSILLVIVAVILSLLLVASLVYYNFIHKNPEQADNLIGTIVFGMNIPLYDEEGLTENTFNVLENTEKLTVINFWGTWCGPCVQELPYFDKIASDYKDDVTVLAVHSNRLNATATDFINQYYPNSNIVFGKDFPNESGKITDPELYYTALGGSNNTYPMTLIVDEYGIIRAHYVGSVTHEELVSDIEKLLK